MMGSPLSQAMFKSPAQNSRNNEKYRGPHQAKDRNLIGISLKEQAVDIKNNAPPSSRDEILKHHIEDLRGQHLPTYRVCSPEEIARSAEQRKKTIGPDRWVCETCARKCSVLDDACIRCWNPRDKSEEGIQKAKAMKAKQLAFLKKGLSPGHWICTQCLYVHAFAERSWCHRCNTFRSNDTLQSSDSQQDGMGSVLDARIAAAVADQRQMDTLATNAQSWASKGNWSCIECGHQNSRQDWVCRECQTSREAVPHQNTVAPKTSHTQEVNSDQYWRHLKRKGRSNGPPDKGTSSNEASEVVSELDANGLFSRREEEQQARFRKAAEGNFVGFDTDPELLPNIRRTFAEPSDSLTGPMTSAPTSKKENMIIRHYPTEGKDPPLEHSAYYWAPAQERGDDSDFKRNLVRNVTIGVGGVEQSDAETVMERDSGVARGRARSGFPEQENVARSYKPASSAQDRDRVYARQRSHAALDDFDDYEVDDAPSSFERKRQRKKNKIAQKAAAAPTPIILPEFISIGNLATALKVRVEDFVRKMKVLGFSETSNDHILDAETAGLIVTEFNFEPMLDQEDGADLVALPPTEDKSLLLSRPPVITIMGHVDHGKTTLLDWLRKSSVAASEHGGITQHIGAFTVPMPSGRVITFLDTPGHAAFLSMRQRGANVTDIVILVVAADDSVKPQTIEAIKHAQAAKVPMIVAINKIDKEDSNIERVKQDLSRHGVEIEDFGGETQVVCVSGKTGQGMEELEDAAVALADVLDMRAETDGQVEGWVLEATTRKAGRVATVLIRRGTIAPGAVVVAGKTWARVRALRNEAGTSISSAGPGTPVEIDGWREQPEAGDEVLQAPNERRAREVVEYRLSRSDKSKMAEDVVAVNEARRAEQEKREREARLGDEGEARATRDTATGMKEIPFIIRADVSGSVEAVLNSVSSLGNSEVRPSILRTAVGPVTSSDIEHAAVAKGHIISFNTSTSADVRRLAESSGVTILEQNIIYRLIDDVKKKLEEVLPSQVTQRVVGEAEIAQVFDINVKKRVMVPIAGCRVRNGVISRGTKVRVLRNKAVVFEGMFYFVLFSFGVLSDGPC